MYYGIGDHDFRSDEKDTELEEGDRNAWERNV